MGYGHHHHHHCNNKHTGTIARLRLAFFLNLIFAVIELVGGIYTQSLAVTSDALHDFGDAIALGMALFLEKSSRQNADQKYTYGYRRLSALSAVFTGGILLAGSFWIIKESIDRWTVTQEPQTTGMIFLALLGIVVNGYAAWKVSEGQSLNEKMIRWHLIEDVMGWVIVLVGAVVIKIFNWPQLDAILAIILSIWVIYNVLKNLRLSLPIFLQATPHGLDVKSIGGALLTIDGVVDVHHLHIWSLDGEEHILTAHVRVQPDMNPKAAEELKNKIKKHLQQYGITEATIEIEWSIDSCVDPHHHN